MPDYDQGLEKSLERLQKLKANIHVWQIQNYIDELRAKWKPKTKNSEFEIYHGSKKGDIESTTLYWDELSLKWTTKESAFKGYVFKKVSEFLNK